MFTACFQLLQGHMYIPNVQTNLIHILHLNGGDTQHPSVPTLIVKILGVNERVKMGYGELMQLLMERKDRWMY